MLFYPTIRTPDRHMSIKAEHQEIITAIESKDLSRVYRAYRRHVSKPWPDDSAGESELFKRATEFLQSLYQTLMKSEETNAVVNKAASTNRR